MVREAEAATSARYARVYVARPDVLVWKAIDLRRYCAEHVYVNNCPKCQADFHFVVTSEQAESLSKLERHAAKYPGMKLSDVHRYVEGTMRTRLIFDHVVAGRHEETLNKVEEKPRKYMECCACASGCIANAGAPSCSSDKEAKAKAACRKVPFVRDPAPSAFGRHTPAWVGEIPSGPNADVWRPKPAASHAMKQEWLASQPASRPPAHRTRSDKRPENPAPKKAPPHR